jgi:hypothetical protein
MADEADLAQEYLERMGPLWLANSKRPVLPQTGACHYCGEAVEGRLFCDNKHIDGIGCHGDWEREEGIRSRQYAPAPGVEDREDRGGEI